MLPNTEPLSEGLPDMNHACRYVCRSWFPAFAPAVRCLMYVKILPFTVMGYYIAQNLTTGQEGKNKSSLGQKDHLCFFRPGTGSNQMSTVMGKTTVPVKQPMCGGEQDWESILVVISRLHQNIIHPHGPVPGMQNWTVSIASTRSLWNHDQ
ncbi:hypothetical protein CHS0354_013907 [Potamilus streckersoni]|uniref:Uncharacterized protein n=1 Tax=Potamilus streckersoni TaxID=2493646 RepID=A0AAE0RWT5_9BIVA|nr:hypothetical protein CHS0354_013907 [Potamilus streckersoni]